MKKNNLFPKEEKFPDLDSSIYRIPLPKGNLYYLDFKYDDVNNKR